MTENEALLIRNLLNGVEPPQAARGAGLDEADALAVFAEAMKRVAEYRLVHCMPFFECGTLAQARAARFMVMDALDRIARWDDGERELMARLFRDGRAELPRAELESVLRRTLDALPHYMEKGELREYYRDRMAFIRGRRARVIELLEKFVSFRAPLLYRNIEHVGFNPTNAEDVALLIAAH